LAQCYLHWFATPGAVSTSRSFCESSNRERTQSEDTCSKLPCSMNPFDSPANQEAAWRARMALHESIRRLGEPSQREPHIQEGGIGRKGSLKRRWSGRERGRLNLMERTPTTRPFCHLSRLSRCKCFKSVAKVIRRYSDPSSSCHASIAYLLASHSTANAVRLLHVIVRVKSQARGWKKAIMTTTTALGFEKAITIPVLRAWVET
jgi:hypothetical protein